MKNSQNICNFVQVPLVYTAYVAIIVFVISLFANSIEFVFC